MYSHSHSQRTHQLPAALRVRTALLAYGGTDTEVQTRVAFADVLHRLRQPQARFTTADSTVLANIAAANVGFSEVACTTLRYFRPTACGGATATGSGSLRPAVTAKPAAPIRLARLDKPAPNPAQETVRLSYALPHGQQAGELWLTHLLSGKRMLTQQVVGAEGIATVSVTGIKPGLYAVTLVVAGQLLATQKLTLIP